MFNDKRGKPCAAMALQDRFINDAVARIEKDYKLHCFMLEIIKNLPEQPISAYDHWILGKAFGYSDEAIKEYIETKV